LDDGLALDLGGLEAHLADEDPGFDVAPHPKRVAVAAVLDRLDPQALADLLARARAPEPAGPVPAGDPGIGEVGGRPRQVTPRLGYLGDEALAARCGRRVPPPAKKGPGAYSGQKSAVRSGSV